jgi:UDP-glucuronate decarboxylase
MRKGKPREIITEMQSANDIVQIDLDFIVDQLKTEFASMEGTNLLIAGGAGFLGHYLVQGALRHNLRYPKADPIRVTVLDNYVRGVPTWLKDVLASNANLCCVEHDITKPIPGGLGNFEYIIHAASIASPIFYRKCPIETMDANVGGLRHMLDYAEAQANYGFPVKGMLFYSSSEIYGDPTPESIPTPETYRGNVSCTGPRACYDESKRYGETLCVNFAAQRGIAVKVARPFNNYGPGLKISDRRVIPDFARDIFEGRDIVILSDGTPKRTYCYVADAVCGYFKILVNGRPGEAYNIGVETPEISVAELAEKMVATARRLGGHMRKVILRKSEDADYLIDNPNRRCPVITKARTELGYDPQVGLDEGLRRSIIWYGGNRNAADA